MEYGEIDTDIENRLEVLVGPAESDDKLEYGEKDADIEGRCPLDVGEETLYLL